MHNISSVGLTVILLLLGVLSVLTAVNSVALYKINKLSGAFSKAKDSIKKENITAKGGTVREENISLHELAEAGIEKGDRDFKTYTFNELDAFDNLEHTETDPDRLLKILEFGLPDEELEAIIKELDSGK